LKLVPQLGHVKRDVSDLTTENIITAATIIITVY